MCLTDVIQLIYLGDNYPQYLYKNRSKPTSSDFDLNTLKLAEKLPE